MIHNVHERSRKASGRAPRVRSATPSDQALAMTDLSRVDWSDCHQIALAEGASHDPDFWRRRMFGSTARRSGLLMIRDVLGRLVGLQRAQPGAESPGAFAVLGAAPGEIMIGGDERHLHLRISITVSEPAGNHPALLAVTTAVQFRNAWGRRYLRVIAPFHRQIVPRMLRRAVRSAM